MSLTKFSVSFYITSAQHNPVFLLLLDPSLWGNLYTLPLEHITPALRRQTQGEAEFQQLAFTAGRFSESGIRPPMPSYDNPNPEVSQVLKRLPSRLLLGKTMLHAAEEA